MDIVSNSTYVINLDSRNDRWKHVSNILDSHDIKDYKRYSAVVGSEISNGSLKIITSSDVMKKINNPVRDSNTQLTKGGIGCALSHINLWKIIANSSCEYGLIFEDDIVFSGSLFGRVNSKKILDTLLNMAKKENVNWDILLLQPMKPYRLEIVKYQGKSIIHYKGYDLVKQYAFWGLGGYFITRECARKLLTKVFPLEYQIDTFLTIQNLAHYISIYSITPNIVNQNISLGTNIQNLCYNCDTNKELHKYVRKEELLEMSNNYISFGYFFISYVEMTIFLLFIYLLVYYKNIK